MHRPLRYAPLAGLAAVALALTGCSAGAVEVADRSLQAPVAPGVDPAGESPAAVVPSAEPVPASPSAAPSDAASAKPEASPEPAASRAPVASSDVVAAQRVLTDGGYYVGALDGRRGSALRSALMAFQKVNGLSIDGAIGPATLKALASPRQPVLRGSSPSNRVEVDLTRQVLYVVKGGKISRIMPVSSGNGATYRQKDGSKARALTPVGYYTIQRRIVGERKADLGTLYDPQYFYGGWAIHGSNSVPAGPASHGCVRVTRADAKTLLRSLSNGMAVYLYGGQHTFAAGSSAPGTDNPTGDTPSDAAPEPAETTRPTVSEPTRTPSRQPSTRPSTAPSRAPSQAPRPSPSTVSVSPSPSIAATSPSSAGSSPSASPPAG